MKTTILLLLTANCFWGCDQTSKFPESFTENSIDTAWKIKTDNTKMIVVDGKYNIWTKKVGEGKIKVLLLPGEPGFTQDYFECFEEFLPKEGIEFYYYDQLGTGNSDIPTDSVLLNTSRFVEEIEHVRKGLKLDNFYILGHFWGGVLAMEYLQKYQNHVKAAILSSMTAGVKSYAPYSGQLKKKTFTEQDIKTYDSLDRLKLHDSPEYQDLLVNKLYAWNRLPNIKVPTLVIGGMYEERNPEDIKKEGKLIPNSRTYLCPDGSHLSIYDDQQNYFSNLVAFLKDVENNKFVADKK
ncbi:proline iminopeptidase [Pedobacter ginsengisoli]|uniref:Proline iminopeptidase n=1 Tax=Pedobacter ginsengisoli TaxID=363852 RepID=A0A2D1U2G5_9SPHI|nr:alpha/beta fold hydrolase [Pedobacter ginsengisoli]ATP55789.1 proline iminopeptidase [Pedobacter ginsengisoli]